MSYSDYTKIIVILRDIVTIKMIIDQWVSDMSAVSSGERGYLKGEDARIPQSLEQLSAALCPVKFVLSSLT